MALITSECGDNAFPEHQTALITSGCVQWFVHCEQMAENAAAMATEPPPEQWSTICEPAAGEAAGPGQQLQFRPEWQVSHGLQLQALWIIPTAAVS